MSSDYPLWGKSLNFATTAHAVCSSRLYHEPHVPLKDSPVPMDPSANMEQQESKQEVHKAVATLPETDRMIVKLVHFENMTERDVGSCMAMPAAKVRRALNRAREMLKARLA